MAKMNDLKTVKDFVGALMTLYPKSYENKELWYEQNMTAFSELDNYVDFSKLLHLVIWENQYQDFAPSTSFILGLAKRAIKKEKKTEEGIVSFCVIEDGKIKEYAYLKRDEVQYLPWLKKQKIWWFGAYADCPKEFVPYVNETKTVSFEQWRKEKQRKSMSSALEGKS